DSSRADNVADANWIIPLFLSKYDWLLDNALIMACNSGVVTTEGWDFTFTVTFSLRKVSCSHFFTSKAPSFVLLSSIASKNGVPRKLSEETKDPVSISTPE
ncbi:hypothetical protein A2U01_0061928, partial [Trifolium medium]|nr:hypothetical protein [Trifolium medium]